MVIRDIMSKVRVAFFADILVRDFDGASRTIYELIDRIPDDRFEFAFFCGMPPKNTFTKKLIKAHALPIPLNKDYKIAVPYFTSRRLTQELDKFNPDVIHITTPSLLGFFALKYARKRNIPVITIYHTHFISYIRYYTGIFSFIKNPLSGLAQFIMKSFYNHCDRIYIPTEITAAEIVRLGIKRDLIRIWPRGISGEIFHSGPHRNYDFSKIISKDKSNILFASRLVWEKNLKILIQIYKLSRMMGNS